MSLLDFVSPRFAMCPFGEWPTMKSLQVAAGLALLLALCVGLATRAPIERHSLEPALSESRLETIGIPRETMVSQETSVVREALADESPLQGATHEPAGVVVAKFTWVSDHSPAQGVALSVDAWNTFPNLDERTLHEPEIRRAHEQAAKKWIHPAREGRSGGEQALWKTNEEGELRWSAEDIRLLQSLGGQVLIQLTEKEVLHGVSFSGGEGSASRSLSPAQAILDLQVDAASPPILRLDKLAADLVVQVHYEEEKLVGDLTVYCGQIPGQAIAHARSIDMRDPVMVSFLEPSHSAEMDHEHGSHCPLMVVLENHAGRAERVVVGPALRGPRTVSVTLPPRRDIEVHLLDPPNWPGLEVRAALLPTYNPMRGATAVADSRGRVLFEEVGLSRAYLLVELCSTEQAGDDPPVVSRVTHVFDDPVDLSTGRTRFEVKLPQFEEITGTAVGCQGGPLGPGHSVGLYTGWGDDGDEYTSSATTDSSGRFRLRVPHGQGGLISTASNFLEGHSILNGPLLVMGGDQDVQVHYHYETLSLGASSECLCATKDLSTDLVEVPLEVVDEEGVPVSGAEIFWSRVARTTPRHQSIFLAIHGYTARYDGATLRLPRRALDGRGLLLAKKGGAAFLDGIPVAGSKVVLRGKQSPSVVILVDALLGTSSTCVPTGVQFHTNAGPTTAHRVGQLFYLPDVQSGDRVEVRAPGYYPQEVTRGDNGLSFAGLVRLPR